GDGVAVAAEAMKIEDLAGKGLFREVAFVLFEERPDALQASDPVEAVVGLVDHEANARVARGERDDPRPIARAHQVIRRAPAMGSDLGLMPCFVALRHEFRDVELALDAKPPRVGVVARAAGQLHPAAEQGVSAGRVDDPAGTDAKVFIALDELDFVKPAIIAQIDRLDLGALDEARAIVDDHLAHVVFEASPVDLIRTHDRLLTRADLDPRAGGALAAAWE